MKSERTLAAKLGLMAKKVYSLRLNEQLVLELEALAKKENRNLSNFIETYLIKLVDESKKKKPLKELKKK